jgi:hypothetical protein
MIGILQFLNSTDAGPTAPSRRVGHTANATAGRQPQSGHINPSIGKAKGLATDYARPAPPAKARYNLRQTTIAHTSAARERIRGAATAVVAWDSAAWQTIPLD